MLDGGLFRRGGPWLLWLLCRPLCCAWALGAGPWTAYGVAQTPLHVPLPDVTDDEVQAVLARYRAEGALPVSGAAGPGQGPPLSGAAPAASAGGQDTPGRRTSRFRPDRDTALSAPLPYVAVFEPSVAPFKRLSVLDAVLVASDGTSPLLTVARPRRQPVQVRPRRAVRSGMVRFVGQVRADFSAGSLIPLPSVAPDMVVRSLASSPAVPLRIERDGAGNFFLAVKPSARVRAGGGLQGPGDGGQSAQSGLGSGTPAQVPIDVSFVVDVREAYFGAPIPNVSLAALPRLKQRVPRRVRRHGLAVAERLGVHPESDGLREALFALVAHFRSFRESDQPLLDRGNVYLDLALGKQGICRHRAYAFVVTALSLGIDARFVQNEAHSFVEVSIPKLGPMRIDLGGAAGGLDPSAMAGRSMHAPTGQSGLPQPEAYQDSYARSRRAALEVQPGREAKAEAVGRWLTERDLGPSPPGQAPPATNVAARKRPGATDTVQSERRQSSLSQSDDRRAPLTLHLERENHRVVRGMPLRLLGWALDQQQRGVAGLTIEVSLGLRDRPRRMLLGLLETDETGAFSGELPVPKDLEPARYQLHVLTAGNGHYRAARAL